MKKISMEISSIKMENLPQLLVSVNGISSKFSLDVKGKAIILDELKTDDINSVITAINAFADIDKLIMENTSSKATSENVATSVAEETLSTASTASSNAPSSNGKRDVSSKAKSKRTVKREFVSKEEIALSEALKAPLAKLDESAKRTSSTDFFAVNFIQDIKMNGFVNLNNKEMILYAFIIARKLPIINYKNLVTALHKKFSTIPEAEISKFLKSYFRKWLSNNYPELIKSCPKIAITSLLKVFVKHLPKEQSN